MICCRCWGAEGHAHPRAGSRQSRRFRHFSVRLRFGIGRFVHHQVVQVRGGVLQICAQGVAAIQGLRHAAHHCRCKFQVYTLTPSQIFYSILNRLFWGLTVIKNFSPEVRNKSLLIQTSWSEIVCNSLFNLIIFKELFGLLSP